MTFLPYAEAGIGSWFTASGGAALAHGAVLAASLSGMVEWLNLTEPTPAAQPEYTITLERLDSDTIAGLLEQQGEAATEDGQGDDLSAAEEPEEPEVETLAALPAEDVAEPEPEEQPAVEPEAQLPEEVEALEATEAEALQPEVLAPVTAEPTTPLVEEDLGPLISETVTALPPTTEALTPIVPEGTAAMAIPAPSEPQALAPVNSTNAVVAAVQRPETTATPKPETKPAPPPSAQDLAIGDLLRRIRAVPHEDCLLALPRRDGEEGVGLALIASSEAAMMRFSEALLTAEDDGIRQTRTLVDERQCAALNYVRGNGDYPATRLGVRLDADEVPSGGRLTGVLRGTAGRYVVLLLVDNNGVAQDLQRFVSFSGNFARFDVPVTRAGAPRDSKQLLLAIATRRPSRTIRDRAGQLARDVFAGLEGELATGAALAVTTFDVR